MVSKPNGDLTAKAKPRATPTKFKVTPARSTANLTKARAIREKKRSEPVEEPLTNDLAPAPAPMSAMGPSASTACMNLSKITAPLVEVSKTTQPKAGMSQPAGLFRGKRSYGDGTVEYERRDSSWVYGTKWTGQPVTAIARIVNHIADIGGLRFECRVEGVPAHYPVYLEMYDLPKFHNGPEKLVDYVLTGPKRKSNYFLCAGQKAYEYYCAMLLLFYFRKE